MAKEIWVIAGKEGDLQLKVPLEGAPRRAIGVEPVKVPLTYYYRRRLDQGELLEVEGPQE